MCVQQYLENSVQKRTIGNWTIVYNSASRNASREGIDAVIVKKLFYDDGAIMATCHGGKITLQTNPLPFRQQKKNAASAF